MAESLQNRDLRARSLSEPLMTSFTSCMAVLHGDDDEARSSGRGRRAFSPMSQYFFRGRAVQGEDASAHGLVKGLRELSCHRRCHAQRLVDSCSSWYSHVQPRRYGFLAGARRLPDMAHIRKRIVRSERPTRVHAPGAKKLRTFTRQPESEVGPPIVPDEVDRGSNLLEFCGQPEHIFVVRGTEAIGDWRSKAGRGQQHWLIRSQTADQRLPHGFRLGITVHEDHAHGSERYGARPAPSMAPTG